MSVSTAWTLINPPCSLSPGLFSDLHQRPGPQRGLRGEGQQPLHGGHRPGDPDRSGGGGRAGLPGHEALEEEEERWAAVLGLDLWPDSEE